MWWAATIIMMPVRVVIQPTHLPVPPVPPVLSRPVRRHPRACPGPGPPCSSDSWSAAAFWHSLPRPRPPPPPARAGTWAQAGARAGEQGCGGSITVHVLPQLEVASCALTKHSLATIGVPAPRCSPPPYAGLWRNPTKGLERTDAGTGHPPTAVSPPPLLHACPVSIARPGPR